MVFLPFESIVLKYFPVSDVTYSLLRMLIEFLIYLLLIYVISSKLISKVPFSTNPIHRPLVIFIFYALALIIINSAPFVDSLINIRAIFRYLALFYVIININLEYRTIVKLTNTLIGIAVLQSCISVYQHFFGISQFWMPRANVLEIAGKVSKFRILGESANRSGREIGVGIGTFSDSLGLSMYLVIVSAILIPFLFKRFNNNAKSRFWVAACMVILIVGLLYSYSRGSFLIVMLMFPVAWLLLNKIKKTALIISLSLIVLVPTIIVLDDAHLKSNEEYINPVFEYVSPIDNVTSIFTKSYQNRTLESSRGFMITVIGGEILQSLPFLGYGPAMNFALEKAIEENFKYVKINNLHMINDVFWIAFIIYFGLIGLSIFLYMLYKLLMVSLFVLKNSPLLYHKSLALSYIIILITAVPYTFIIRTFIFRQYSFYFWSLAALTVVEWIRLKNNRKSETLKAN